MKSSEALLELKDSIKGEGYQCHKEVYEIAISALEKQIPQTPGHYKFREMGKIVLPCPNCDSDLDGGEEYCKYCGQAIKWC